MSPSTKSICTLLLIFLTPQGHAARPSTYIVSPKAAALMGASIFTLGLGTGRWCGENTSTPSLTTAVCIGTGCLGLLYSYYSLKKRNTQQRPPARPHTGDTPSELEPGAPTPGKQKELEEKEQKYQECWDRGWKIPPHMMEITNKSPEIRMMAIMLTHAYSVVSHAFRSIKNPSLKIEINHYTPNLKQLKLWNNFVNLITPNLLVDQASANKIFNSCYDEAEEKIGTCGEEFIEQLSYGLVTRCNKGIDTNPHWLLSMVQKGAQCEVCTAHLMPSDCWVPTIHLTESRYSRYSTQQQLMYCKNFTQHKRALNLTCSLCKCITTEPSVTHYISALPPLLFVYSHIAQTSISLDIDLEKFCTQHVTGSKKYRLLSIIFLHKQPIVTRGLEPNTFKTSTLLLLARNKERTQWDLYDNGKVTANEGDNLRQFISLRENKQTKKTEAIKITNLARALMLYQQVS